MKVLRTKASDWEYVQLDEMTNDEIVQLLISGKRFIVLTQGLDTYEVDILPMAKARGFQLSLVGFPASLKLAFPFAFQLTSGSYSFSTG